MKPNINYHIMMNRIKLICLDVDNTLVDKDKNIPDQNLEAIRWAHTELGVHVAVNSGRISGSTRDYMERLGVYEAFPSLGGCIVQNWDGSVIEEHIIDRQVARAVNLLARQTGCTNFVYHRDRWYLDPGNDFWASSEFQATRVPGTFLDTDAFLASTAPTKMLGVHTDPERTTKLEQLIRKDFSQYVDCFKSDPRFLEIVPKGINKGTAVRALCSFYGIERENVMSLGDFYNDLDMFRESSISVAMANAPEDVKSEASFVTKHDADHAGVAEAIYHFLKN